MANDAFGHDAEGNKKRRIHPPALFRGQATAKTIFKLYGGHTGEENGARGGTKHEGKDESSCETSRSNSSRNIPSATETKSTSIEVEESNGKEKSKAAVYSLSGITREMEADCDEPKDNTPPTSQDDGENNDEADTGANPASNATHTESSKDSSTDTEGTNNPASAVPDEGKTTNTKGRVEQAPPSDCALSKGTLSAKILLMISRNRGLHGNKESTKLRDLVAERCEEYVGDLEEFVSSEMPTRRRSTPPHPKKVLHFLAPKIPAIKHSPNFTLRIKSAKADLDAGLAAYVIGSVAGITELYEALFFRSDWGGDNGDSDVSDTESSSASEAILSDRRFEQLIECVLCGINTEENDVILSHGVDQNDNVDDGVSALDASFAAWGMALLGVERLRSIGGSNSKELFVALALRCREVLLTRQRNLRLGIKRLKDDDNLVEETRSKFDETFDGLVKDAASALWAFACVKSCAGIRSDLLVDACCSILAQDEETFWAAEGKNNDAAMEEIVERLAASDSSRPTETDYEENSSTSTLQSPLKNTESISAASAVQNTTTGSTAIVSTAECIGRGDESSNPDNGEMEVDSMKKRKTLLIYRLLPKDCVNIIWALALHDSSDNVAPYCNSESESGLHVKSPKSEVLFDLLLDRIGDVLDCESKILMERNKSAERVKLSLTSCDETCEIEKDFKSVDHIESFGDETSGIQAPETKESKADGAEIVDCDMQYKEGGNSNGVEPETRWMSCGAKADASEKAPSSENGDRNIETIREGDEIVDVIDAAAILEAETLRTNPIPKNATPIIATQETKDDRRQSVLPGSASNDYEDGGLERSGDKTTLLNEDSGASKEVLAEPSNYSPPLDTFSIRDLCSTAWAVTELRRSSSNEIVGKVANILLLLGRDHLMYLGGTDLSNLAWAIAKSMEASNVHQVDPSMQLMTRWIAESAMLLLSGERSSPTGYNGVNSLEPPELSRLLWSLSYMDSASKGIMSGGHEKDSVLDELARFALQVAASNLPVFSVEDCARIIWAFTELADTSKYLQTTVAESFGRVQATIEASLLRWESGQKSSSSSQQSGDNIRHAGRFPSTLFGKSRLSQSLLNLKISVHDEDDEEELSQQSQSLPALKDLTVDPSTLCKLAFGLSQISRRHPHIIGGEQVLRIATRLFASKNGRLLAECNYKDVIRMCCACVDTMKLAGKEIRGADREFVLRQFPRRVVQLLNKDVPTNGTKSSSLNQLPPSDLAALFFSLGELGVKACVESSNPQLEYRKLRLVPKCPLLTDDQLSSLSPSASVSLLCGLIAIGDNSNGSMALARSFADLQLKVHSLEPQNICRLSASLVKLCSTDPVGFFTSGNVQSRKNSILGAADAIEESTEPHEKTKVESSNPEDSGEAIVSPEAEKVIESLSPSNGRDHQQREVQNQCTRTLQLVFEDAAAKISQFSGEQLRRMLLHIVILPFQADSFVGAVEVEVERRLAALECGAAASVASTLQDSKGGAVVDMQHGAAFELGRCQELLARYRRLEFTESGYCRRTRYDEERRKGIGKRVASRLFQ